VPYATLARSSLARVTSSDNLIYEESRLQRPSQSLLHRRTHLGDWRIRARLTESAFQAYRGTSNRRGADLRHLQVPGAIVYVVDATRRRPAAGALLPIFSHNYTEARIIVVAEKFEAEETYS